MAKTSANYELLYIIDPALGEEGVAALVAKFKTLIEGAGEISAHDEWGKRKLAYLIDDKPDGYYVLVRFSCAPDFPAELRRVLGITEGIMRELVTLVEE